MRKALVAGTVGVSRLAGFELRVANEVKRIDLSDIVKNILNEAVGIKTYLPGVKNTRYSNVIDPISAYSRKKLQTNPSATSGEALFQPFV
tara:strand:+ start:440 stop:709 length:270 start_codon:yes stop_codon:yes gene_type:complete